MIEASLLKKSTFYKLNYNKINIYALFKFCSQSKLWPMSDLNSSQQKGDH